MGVISLASASYADLKANLKIAGTAETDITVVPVGAGASARRGAENDRWTPSTAIPARSP